MPLSEQDVVDGKYQIVRLLGEGGMGAVYEGLNTRIQRRVAIKVLHGDVAKNADAATRFEREAQAAGRIGSKHIVEVLDLGDLGGGERYMVMEYLDGEDLTRRIRKLGRLAPEEVFPIAMQILEGLAAAHQAGIVHRDLKPDNIYLIPAGERADFVKILDFGISKFSAKSAELSMTQTGMVMGTPYYMSPEQAKGSRDLDARTDIYAVGVIVYEALSGSVPHAAETFNELILKIVLEDAPPLTAARNEADRAFFAIVHKAMARDREQRFQSAGAFQAALQQWAADFQITPVEGIKPGSGAYRHTRSQGTESAWDKTALGTMAGDPPAAPTKKNTRLPLVAGALAVIVLAGGALGYKWKAAAEQQALAAQVAAEAEEQRRTELEAKQQQELEQQRAAAEQARLEAEEAKKRADTAENEADLQRAEAERLAAERAAQQAQATEAAVRQAATPRPATQRRPAPAPAKAEKQTTAKTSTGRTIRADF